VVFEGVELTYRELNEQSNQLAHCLREDYGVLQGDLVGILLDRSEWFVVSMLGVLKSGGAYVPIDPAYPNERVGYFIKDTGVKLLVSTTDYMFALGNYDCTVFTIDAEFELGVHSTTNIGISLSSEDLAYVIYTSGSTGSPKGVMVEHGGVRNTILSQISGFNLGEDRIGLQFASFSFDASVSEMFIILLSGGKLYVASETERKDVSLLEHSIVRHKINIATFSPSHLQLLDISKLTGIKTL